MMTDDDLNVNASPTDDFAREQPQEVDTLTSPRRILVGLPASADPAERRFPLTPEGVRYLSDHGFIILVERGAAAQIHYSDQAYANAGARITSRAQTLAANIVIHLAPLALSDIRQLARGALLLSLANFSRPEAPQVIKRLLDRRIVNIAIDLVADSRGNHPFADLLAEVDGRAALTVAAGMLADSANGKGILLGGISGVVPCEVTIIGATLGGIAAARAALGGGAVVRLFDDDVYRLRSALRTLGSAVQGSTTHTHALENALRGADVIIAAAPDINLRIDADAQRALKHGVLVFDLTPSPGAMFLALPCVDLSISASQAPARSCYFNAGNTVPRTAAMGLSDTFITMLGQLAGAEQAASALHLSPGLQEGTLTFLGHAVNPVVASLAGVRHRDIRLLQSLS